jgi:hypothetical protein
MMPITKRLLKVMVFDMMFFSKHTFGIIAYTLSSRSYLRIDDSEMGTWAL